MKKLVLKLLLYIFLILLLLEIMVRAFHLYAEDPPRFIDDLGVEKRVPGYRGYSVTGNRNQNFSEFNINKAGFNSHREFTPSKDKYEIALIGDSFIEGFHQDFDNSIAVKIEAQLDDTEVYQYGYAGYDLANQMHLIHAYKQQFDLTDEIILYLNYQSDLYRGSYEPNVGRIKKLSSTIFKVRDNIKLLSYGSKIGVIEPIKNLLTGRSLDDNPDQRFQEHLEKLEHQETPETQKQFLDNFKSLVELYGYDKCKTTLLLDSRKTSDSFLKYCRENNFKYIDFAPTFELSEKPVTLIYDRHWNNHGRDLIAKVVSEYFKTLDRAQECE
ncbi:hypothetical protein [Flagellimonas flava]|uniref:hypothetical protein n=1 Tax=Flagellimonas flava TaxID=570519 RepID=UPI003D6548E4